MSFIAVRTETPYHDLGHSRPFVGESPSAVEAVIDEMAVTHGTKIRYFQPENGRMRQIKNYIPISARLERQPVAGEIFVGIVTYPNGDVAISDHPEMNKTVQRFRRAYPTVKYDGNSAIVDTQHHSEGRRLQIWKCEVNGYSREVPVMEWCDWVGAGDRARAAEAVNKPLADAFLQEQLAAGIKLPLGMCFRCGLKQSSPRKDGFWICGEMERWACANCKYGHNGPEIRSVSLGNCEVCCSENITPYQGRTYDCHDCAAANALSAASVVSAADTTPATQ